MNISLQRELLSAAGKPDLDGLPPVTVLAPMLNLGQASDMLQLAAMLGGRPQKAEGRGQKAVGSRQTDINHRPPATNHSISTQHSALRIVVLSVVEVPPDEPLTMGLEMARSYRALLDFLPSEVDTSGRQVRVDRVVKVARDVAGAIHEAAREERADIILLAWKGYAREPKRHLYGRIADATLKNPPCSVVLARLEGWRKSRRVFLPVRGGPSAEQALDLGLSLAERLSLPLTVMHNVPAADEGRRTGDEGLRTEDGRRRMADGGHAQVSQVEALGEEPYIVFNEHLRQAQERAAVAVESILTRQPDPVAALIGEVRGDDILIMGLPSPSATPMPSVVGADFKPAHTRDSVALRVSKELSVPLLLLSAPTSIDLADYTSKVRAGRSKKRWVDMPFEHWFVEHTYHGDEFKDPEEFLKAKLASGLSLSVALLTSNDAKHIYSALTGLKRVLQELHPIADQIAVIDAGSTDGTPDMARELGAEVYAASEILPAQGDLHGRGECWWKSLAVLRGDIIVWLDVRAPRFHPSAVLSLAGPLLRMPTLQLVKAFGRAAATKDEGRRTKDEGRKLTRHSSLITPPKSKIEPDEFSPVDMSWGGFVVPHRDSANYAGSAGRIRVQALKPDDLEALTAGQVATLPPRTLLQALSPSLAGVIAPFSRDMAARHEAMLSMPVFAGESLDVGLLLSVAAEFGTHSIAQVELRHSRPGPPPSPGTRTAIDILQIMALRLQDPAMRLQAARTAERLQKELEARHAPSQSEGAATAFPLFELRALGPVERPPMRWVLRNE